MNCANCGSSNESGQKFCGHCGRSLVVVCPNGHSNPPGNLFCGECGSSLTEDTPPTSPATEPGERRLVSALFADLVGFTTLSEARDPEDVRAILTRYFDRCREIIERFGGEVDKFIGDAVTAFWGITQTEEDDSERAVRAAIELAKGVDGLAEELNLPELAVRVGVLSGEASVGSGGNDKGLVVGDIVNSASRLQSMAEPRTVLVGDSTKLMTDSAIRYELMGERELKGKTETVTVWRAIGVLAERGGRGKWDILEPPFVGREGELRVLKEHLHATSDKKAARLVSIVGEAGIGKSRLAWELLKYADGLTEVFRWHEGRSPSYGDGVTFWALAEMVRSRAGIAEGDPKNEARIRLRTSVAELVPDPDDQQWIEPKLAGLLGLADMPNVERSELFAALRTYFQHVAADSTAVFLFEDLQWADEGQLDFIEDLVEFSPNHPILAITLSRPDLLDRRLNWGAARNNSFAMRLGPLTEAEMTELIHGMTPGVSQELVELVVARAGGIPLYAVEYVRMLINTGDLVSENGQYRQVRELADVALPDSLHAMVGARLDRLDDEAKSLAQDAAVLGQSFSLEGLTVLTGQTADELEPKLRALARQELVRYEDNPRSPERGQYKFVQSVIREVAYGRIARADRKERHIKVAEFYAESAPVEAAAVIASHYMDAYAASPDEDLANRAREALMGAARRAEELHSLSQALTLAEQALSIPGDPAEKAAIRQFARSPASALFRHQEAIAYAREAYEWYLENGSPGDVARAARVLGTALVEADDAQSAVEVMEPHFVKDQAEDAEMLGLGAELATALMRNWTPESAADVSLTVMMAAEKTGDTESLIDAMNTRGSVLPALHRTQEGIALLREALRLAELNSLSYSTLRALNNLMVVEAVNGLSATSGESERGLELARRLMLGSLLVRWITSRAWTLLNEGKIDEALEVLDEVDPGEESEWTGFINSMSEYMQAVKTGDPVHIERGRAASRPARESDEPQYRSISLDYEVTWFTLEGDHEKVIDIGLKIGTEALASQNYRHFGMAAAIRLGDTAKLRPFGLLIEGQPGRRFEVLRFALETGFELLEGDPNRAATMFVDLCDRMEEVELAMMASYWRATFAEVMPDRPEAKAAAREAYHWYAAAGAQGFLNLFSHVWERQLDEVSLAG